MFGGLVNYDEKPWVKRYDHEIAPEIEIPKTSLIEQFERVASKVPDKPALRFLGTTLTYSQLMTWGDRFAQALISNGCQAGDVVGINLPNIPQYLIAQMGALKAGCAASGVSPLLTPGEMVHQLTDCKAKVLVTLDAIFEHRLARVADQLPDLKLVVSTGVLEFLPAYKRLLAVLLKKVPTGKVTPLPGKEIIRFRDIPGYRPERPSIRVQPGDPCLIQYTGGTTGVPKGAILTDGNLTAELTLVTEWLQMNWGEEVILSGFPFFHIAGLALGLGTLFQGHTQVLVPDPRNTKHIVKEMAQHRPTILVNVPSLYMMLLETPGFKDLDFSRLGFCLSAASPFPAESIKALESVVGAGKVVEAYGMTECSALATCNPRRGKKKVGSVGMPLPNTSVRLMDLESGSKQVAVGAEGEIAVSAPQITTGYFGNPQETALTLREHDGVIWLHTGDVARMDEDGYFYIVDRAKDMLNVGGFKVFSREVEEKLYEHPAIEFCAILGLANPKRPGTEVVKLVFQPAQGYRNRDPEVLKEDVLAFARENLAPYKVPKFVEIVDNIPLTAVGKVDKKALRPKKTGPGL
jgi:acyl-CoA synthetase (AMP-forming)/AMP-acid ligase II